MSDSRPLLREYVEHGSEQAFTELVQLHLPMVYSTALRRVGGNNALAGDVAQAVFSDLAIKARRIDAAMLIAGWLYRHTNFVASNLLRCEARRRRRESEACLMNAHDDPRERWCDMLPLLDEGLACLREADRNAIVLRFLQGQDLRSVGAALGSSEDAAQKRIARALERLRVFFTRRGLPLSTGAIAVGLASQGAAAVPIAAASVAGAALAAIPVAGGTAISILLSNFLVMGKIKTIGAAVVIAGGLAVPLVLQHNNINRLMSENAALRAAAATAPAVTAAPSSTDAQPPLELARLRAEVTRLRQQTQALADKPARELSRSAAPPPIRRPSIRDVIPSDTWADAGLATPEATLQTIGWAIRNGDIPKFKQTVYFTEAAQQVLTDMLARMPAEALAEVRARGWGFEEALLMPAMAQDRRDTYKAYRIVSQESPREDELVVQTEIETVAGKTHKRPMRFRRIGDEWKQYYDADDVRGMK